MIRNAEDVRRWLMNSATCLVIVYLVLPLIVLIPISFTSGNTLTFPTPGWSLRWYSEVFSDERWINAFWNSVVIAVSSTFIASVFGILAAIGLTWGKIPGRNLIFTLAATPLIVPVVIVGVASFSFYASLELVGNRISIILTHAALSVPIVLTTISASLRGFDRTLLRASASLGAGYWRTFYKVLLPMISPGVMTGALIAFIISFDEIVVASFLSIGSQRTLPRLIFSGVRESLNPAIASVAMLLIVFSAFVLALVVWQHSRRVRLSNR
ncbi:MAG: ABC transporter permease [Desulfobacterales bacterium]|nr:MAG: ABC transporter permease [Desulfobacterales bacterium]